MYDLCLCVFSAASAGVVLLLSFLGNTSDYALRRFVSLSFCAATEEKPYWKIPKALLTSIKESPYV